MMDNKVFLATVGLILILDGNRFNNLPIVSYTMNAPLVPPSPLKASVGVAGVANVTAVSRGNDHRMISWSNVNT
jgi:hypothetical protein